VAQSVTRQLIASGHVSRGNIGAEIQGLTPEIAASLGVGADQGALVAGLTPGGPAERGGLKVGEVVVGMDGQAVHTASGLTQRVALVGAGQTVQLQVLRDGHPTAVSLRAGLRPSETQLASADVGGTRNDGDATAQDSARILGMRLAPVDPQTRQRYGLASPASGWWSRASAPGRATQRLLCADGDGGDTAVRRHGGQSPVQPARGRAIQLLSTALQQVLRLEMRAYALGNGGRQDDARLTGLGEAVDGCGAGFHRGPYGGCRPNIGASPVVVGPAVPAFGVFYPGWGYWDGHRYWANRYRWHGGWRYR
jgi:hypothetical protein